MARHLVQRGHRVTMVCGSYGGGKSGLEGQFVRGVRRGQIAGIDLIELELLEWGGHRQDALRLTSRGTLFGNQVFMRFV